MIYDLDFFINMYFSTNLEITSGTYILAPWIEESMFESTTEMSSESDDSQESLVTDVPTLKSDGTNNGTGSPFLVNPAFASVDNVDELESLGNQYLESSASCLTSNSLFIGLLVFVFLQVIG